MELSDFNERAAKIGSQIREANSNPSDETLAQLVIAASLNGLAIMDCDKHDDWMPAPICRFIVYREPTTGETKCLYLFPADQPIPQ